MTGDAPSSGPPMTMPPAGPPPRPSKPPAVTVLKCNPCTDELITGGGTDQASLPDAVTMAPSLQTFVVGGQQVSVPLALPVCFACREKQLGRVSRKGLITA